MDTHSWKKKQAFSMNYKCTCFLPIHLFSFEINNKTLIMLVVGGEVGYFHGDGRQTTLLEGK